MYIALIEQIAFWSMTGLNGLDRFVCVVFAVYCAWSVANGLSTGNIPLKFLTTRRSEMPLVFWFSIVMHCAGAVMFVIGAITGKLN